MRVLVALTLLLCGVALTEAQTDTSCLNDVVACASQIRERCLNNDYYWYGTPYTAQCPGSPFCTNTRPDLQSIASRIVVSDVVATMEAAFANTQFLNVTIQRPARSYFACEAMFDLPAQPAKTLNPLEPALTPQIYLSTQPSVTWTPTTDTTLYSFILIDTSVIYLHTYYINCKDGSLNNCEVVRPWLGTAAIFTINSAYVFLVYEQTQEIPIATAKQAEQETTAAGAAGPVPTFFLSTLFQKLASFYVPDVKFASIMEMYPDPFGSRLLTVVFDSLDQCPLFYSQLPAFQSAVEAMQIPNPNWSTAAFGLSQVATNPTLNSLTINVQVTYDTDDYSDTTCCKKFQITRGSQTVSPLQSMPVRAAMTRHLPRVFLSPIFLTTGAGRSSISTTPYTLVVVDATRIVTSDQSAIGANLTVHWMVANIFASDFFTGTHVVPYSPPTPTNANEPLSLMFLLFAHASPVDPGLLTELCPNGPIMCYLKMTDLISNMGLGDIVGVNWVQVQEDDYSVKRQYTNMGMSENDVCQGRDGYASPCPDESDSAIGQLGFSHPYLMVQLAAMVLVLTHFRA